MFISGHVHVLGLDMRKTRKDISCVAIEKLEQQVRKSSHCSSKQQQRSPDEITLLLLVRAIYICVLLFAHILFMVNRTFNATPTERLQPHPLLFAMNCTEATFFLWRLHLAPLSRLVTAPLCFDWKARAHSFTLQQQATIEIPRRAHFISACSCRIYMGVVLHVHPVCGESHIQHNANREVAPLAAKLG